MTHRLLPAVALALAVVPGTGCKKKPEDPKAQLGPITAAQWREKDADGNLLKCYDIAPDTSTPIRVCGEGMAGPDNNYVISLVRHSFT